MKKRLLIGFIVGLFLIVIVITGKQTIHSYSTLSIVCSDSDGGNDVWAKGTVASQKGYYTDFCTTSSLCSDNSVYEDRCLLEYFCSGDSVLHAYSECPSGFTCTNGACVKAEKPYIAHYTTKCYNNNAWWYDRKGERNTLSDDCSSDEKCQDGKCVKTCSNECDYSGWKNCYGNTGYRTCGNHDSDNCLEWSSMKYCSSGYKCSDNQCVKTCSNECDYSGWKNCYGNTGYRTCGNHDSDNCLEWSSVKYCSSGYKCSNSQCIILCSDSDGGKNVREKGTVSSSRGYDTDYCSTSSLCPDNSGNKGSCLVEYFCYNNNVLHAYSKCPSDYTCASGACIKF